MLERTTNGTDPVFEATLDQIRSLDAGSWFNPTFADSQVPLDEVLALPARVFELEIKTQGRGVLDAVVGYFLKLFGGAAAVENAVLDAATWCGEVNVAVWRDGAQVEPGAG